MNCTTCGDELTSEEIPFLRRRRTVWDRLMDWEGPLDDGRWVNARVEKGVVVEIYCDECWVKKNSNGTAVGDIVAEEDLNVLRALEKAANQ